VYDRRLNKKSKPQGKLVLLVAFKKKGGAVTQI
jgi:hypothetical protein